jgi:hypothetical protein
MVASGESLGSFPSMHSLVRASPATSLIAETFTTEEEVTNTGHTKPDQAEDGKESKAEDVPAAATTG